MPAFPASKPKHKLLVAPLAGAALAAILAGPAHGVEGGATIAGATPLPLNVPSETSRVSSAQDYDLSDETVHDFWTVSLKARDQLTLDLTSTGITDVDVVCVLRPDATDFNYQGGDSNCLFRGTEAAGNRWRLSYIAPTAGTYRIMVYAGDSGFDLDPTEQQAYSFLAAIRHATQLVLSVPRRVDHGARFALKGQLRGTEAPELVAIERRFGRGRWLRLARTTALPSQDFTVRVSLPRKGNYTFRATYAGDRDFLPSRASKSVVSR